MDRNFNKQKALIAPLDWGLGHATRCIPIIKALHGLGYEIVIAASGSTKSLLQQEFSDVKFVELFGYNVRYSKNKKWLPIVLALQIPKIIKAIRTEHKWLQKYLKEDVLDIVISDNRYGLYNKQVNCIFITHQLAIKAPFAWLENWIRRRHYRLIQRFNSCWVPDFAGEQNIAGSLSHPQNMPQMPVHYLGMLSRFETKQKSTKQFAYCFLLSGPEPQRTLLEEAIIRDIGKIEKPILLIRGLPNNTETIQLPSHVHVYNHLIASALENVIKSSELIICRSGYTTVMELLSLQQKALLIPTPGQTEQEYLANRLMLQKWCFTIEQSSFSLLDSIQKSESFNFTFPDFTTENLQQVLHTILLKSNSN